MSESFLGVSQEELDNMSEEEFEAFKNKVDEEVDGWEKNYEEWEKNGYRIPQE